jgi:hypothetical protein
MKTFWIWAKSARWVVLLIFATVLTILGFVLRSLFHTPEKPGQNGVQQRLPEVPQPLREAVAKAEEAALLARVEAAAKAEEQVAKLQETMKLSDGAERRKRLAGMLKDL